MKTRIPLGTEADLTALYSYPNLPNADESLSATIQHWFDQTLQRDGVAEQIKATAILEDQQVYLELVAEENQQPVVSRYAERLQELLAIGQQALDQVIPELHKIGKWDPENTGQWRFFLPLGLAMVRQKSLQFFHYPPIRLLDPMRDYLNDPVPVRWEELLQVNGVSSEQASWLYETVVDATPIAAPDDQGSKKVDKSKYKYGLIPIEYFTTYQTDLVKLLLNSAENQEGYTIPIVIYGAHPREEFEEIFLKGTGQTLGINKVATAEIVPGKKTRVLSTNHPYRFYAQAQIDDKQPDKYYVGCGEIAPGHLDSVIALMKDDLAAAHWQVQMSNDPSQDPQVVLDAGIDYWRDANRTDQVRQLVEHQGSLFYPDPKALEFSFKIPKPA